MMVGQSVRPRAPLITRSDDGYVEWRNKISILWSTTEFSDNMVYSAGRDEQRRHQGTVTPLGIPSSHNRVGIATVCQPFGR